MRWIVIGLGVLFGPLIFTAMMVGLFVQPWSPIWFGQHPVPVAAVPIGDLPLNPPVAAVPVPTAIASSRLEGIVDVARTWLGVPYLWGGCTRRGVDCSCFVRNVLSAFAISAPRTTTEQIRWATPVSRDQLAIGDLVFFNNTCTDCGANPTHVGLYIGGGSMIDAGDPVQINPVFTGFYGARYAGSGRPH